MEAKVDIRHQETIGNLFRSSVVERWARLNLVGVPDDATQFHIEERIPDRLTFRWNMHGGQAHNVTLSSDKSRVAFAEMFQLQKETARV